MKPCQIRNISALIFWALALVASGEARGGEFLDRGRVSRLYDQFQWSSDPDVDDVSSSWRIDRCDSTRLSYKVLKGLIELEDLPPLAAKGDRFDQGILDASPFEFVRKRIKGLHFDSPTSANCPRTVAAYIRSGERIAHICVRSELASAYDMMSILVHEARHVDGHDHVDCSHGYMMGVADACDPSYSYKGAYAAGAELGVRIGRSGQVPLALRQQARADAVESFLNRFNQLPFEIDESLFVQDLEGAILAYRNKVGLIPVMRASRHAVLSVRGGLPVVFDSESGSAVTALGGSAAIDARGVYAEQYRNSFTPERRHALRDVHYGSEYSCLLFGDEVVCDLNEKTYRMKLESVSPLHFLRDRKRLAIVAADGMLAVLPGDISTLSTLRDRDLVRAKNPQGLINFFPFNSSLFIGLTSDGRLVKSDQFDNPPLPVSMVEGVRLKKVVGPVYWSRKLEEL